MPSKKFGEKPKAIAHVQRQNLTGLAQSKNCDFKAYKNGLLKLATQNQGELTCFSLMSLSSSVSSSQILFHMYSSLVTWPPIKVAIPMSCSMVGGVQGWARTTSSRLQSTMSLPTPYTLSHIVVN